MQPLGFFEVGAVDLGVVLQLPRLLDAVVERLTIGRVLVATTGFEQVTSFLGQRDGGRVAVEADRFDEPRIAQMPQIAMARVQGLSNVSRRS